MQLKKLKTKSKLTLKGTLNAYNADDMHQKLKEAYSLGLPLEVMAQDIEHIDTLCCQLLLSASESFRKKELNFSICKPSAPFQASIKLLSLELPYA